MVARALLNKSNAREVAWIGAWVKRGDENQVAYAKKSADVLLRSVTGSQLVAVRSAFRDLGLPTEPQYL